MFLINSSQRISSEQSLTPRDLARYIESLIIESHNRERRKTQTLNYGWLSFKRSYYEATTQATLIPLQPMLKKMSAESCASIYMKIESYVTEDTTVDDIMKILRKLLEEHLSVQMIEQNIAKGRYQKNYKIQPRILYRDSNVFIIS